LGFGRELISIVFTTSPLMAASKDAFMISFGYTRLDPNVTGAWNSFITTKLMKHPQWIHKYDTWTPEGQDWGWMTIGDPEAALTGEERWQLLQMMCRNGFKDNGSTASGNLWLIARDSTRVPNECVWKANHTNAS
jgi:hypothetical protein